jgi:hypothetical protein
MLTLTADVVLAPKAVQIDLVAPGLPRMFEMLVAL